MPILRFECGIGINWVDHPPQLFLFSSVRGLNNCGIFDFFSHYPGVNGEIDATGPTPGPHWRVTQYYYLLAVHRYAVLLPVSCTSLRNAITC